MLAIHNRATWPVCRHRPGLSRLPWEACVLAAAVLLTLGVTSAPVTAQTAPIPYHMEAYRLDSDVHDGLDTDSRLAFSALVEAPEAPWIRLHFDEYDLGDSSYILLTSSRDGGRQRLDADGMANWRCSSAFFKGGRVTVELHVSPGDTGVFISLDELTVGEWVSGGLRSECGADNRISSTDPRVGRIMPVGCTGWIASNGAFLTAGHCVNANMDVLLFEELSVETQIGCTRP